MSFNSLDKIRCLPLPSIPCLERISTSFSLNATLETKKKEITLWGSIVVAFFTDTRINLNVYRLNIDPGH